MRPVFNTVHAGAAVAVKRGAKEAELGHRRDQFSRKPAVAIAVFNDGDEVVFYKLSGCGAHHALFFREQGIEFEEIHTTEFKRHKDADNTERPVAKPGRTLDSNKGRIRRSMILATRGRILPITVTLCRFYHWLRLRSPVMCATW